ncbi:MULTISPECIES: hypothetical protein [Microbacterium]|uniref:ABC transporter permease n=1 Tax=Microbacterium marmarense TaxID=3122051 RepID=A0ABU8LPW0_9MICO
MSRTVNVVRMQFINKQTYVWIPLIILASAFAITLAIYGILIAAGVDGPKVGGGAQAPLWYFFAVGIQALTMTFPFSQAMSVTRREFLGGTLLAAMLASIALAAVFVVGGLIELATDGWGLNGWFFYLEWVWESGPVGAAFVYFVTAMLFFITGLWFATVYRRFGGLGLTVALVGLAVVVVFAMFVIGQLDAWAAVFTWINELGAVGLSLWGVVLLAVTSLVAFLTLRRATP